MATSFDIIIDQGLIAVDDYRLAKLYNQSQDNFQMFCDGLLIRAVPNFTLCRQSLSYDTTTREFVSDFTDLEVSILADYWAIEWMTRYVQNSAQFQAKLQTSGSFRNFSEAQNLKEKASYLDGMREKVSQKETNYQLQDIDSLL